MAEDFVPMKELPITTRQSGEYENKSVLLGDIKEDRYIIARLVKFKEGTKKKNKFFTPEELKRVTAGEEITEPYFLYVLDVTQPAIGIVSTFAKPHQHYALKNFRIGDTVQIIAVKRKSSNGKSYQSIDVRAVVQSLSPEEIAEAVKIIKETQEESGTTYSVETIREKLKLFNITREDDVLAIISQVQQ